MGWNTGNIGVYLPVTERYLSFFNMPFLALPQKIKKSHYRPGQALKGPGL
jgi:hypothetical protein